MAVFILLTLPCWPAFAQTATVSSVIPSSGVQGATVPITLTGTGFLSGDIRLRVSGAGVVVISIRVLDDTHLNAVLILSGAAGTRTIGVETSAGPSNTVAFKITQSPLDSASELFVEHFSGSNGGPGYTDGVGLQARFLSPGQMWGNSQTVYILASKAIRKMDLATARVETVGGLSSHYLRGIWGDGRAMYVVDGDTVNKIDLSSGQVTTIAANLRPAEGLWGDGTYLYFPTLNSVSRIDIATGNVTTLAGSFNFLTSIWGDAGFLYVTDENGLRQINTATGEVRTIATIADEPVQGVLVPRRYFHPAPRSKTPGHSHSAYRPSNRRRHLRAISRIRGHGVASLRFRQVWPSRIRPARPRRSNWNCLQCPDRTSEAPAI
jgi:hypothetical protein